MKWGRLSKKGDLGLCFIISIEQHWWWVMVVVLVGGRFILVLESV